MFREIFNMILVTNFLISLAFSLFSVEAGHKGAEVATQQEEIVLSFEDQPGLEASDFPG